MTQDEIIEMAREAGMELYGLGKNRARFVYHLEAFAKLVAEKEREAWKNAAIRLGEELSSVGPDGYYNMTAEQWLDWAMNQQPRGKNSLSPPQRTEPICPECKAEVLYECVACSSNNYPPPQRTEQEPVIDKSAAIRIATALGWEPKRTWVGLTDEDMHECAGEYPWTPTGLKCVRTIEAKLKQKNGYAEEKNT